MADTNEQTKISRNSVTKKAKSGDIQCFLIKAVKKFVD